MASREIIKSWFQSGSKPLAEHFSQWIDSFWHKQDTITVNNINGLANRLSTIESQLRGKASLAVQDQLVEIVRHCHPISVVIGKGETFASGIIEASTLERSIKRITISDDKISNIKYNDNYNTVDVLVSDVQDIPIKPKEDISFAIGLTTDPLEYDVVVTLYMEYKF